MLKPITMSEIEEKFDKATKNNINRAKKHRKAKSKVYEWNGRVEPFDRTYLIYETVDGQIYFYNTNHYEGTALPKEVLQLSLDME